jgi:hypothetical protein
MINLQQKTKVKIKTAMLYSLLALNLIGCNSEFAANNAPKTVSNNPTGLNPKPTPTPLGTPAPSCADTNQLGAYPNCVDTTCVDLGKIGIYPNCQIPTCEDSNQVGTYPNCQTPTCDDPGQFESGLNCGVLTCADLGQAGTYPNCHELTCADINQTGTYPNCISISCEDSNQSGVYPNCHSTTCADLGKTGSYPNCTTQACPAGQVGIYPNCRQPTCADSGKSGTYPNCHTTTCADLGKTGTYPNCQTPDCTTNPTLPICINNPVLETITQNYPVRAQVDILWMVDNSQSMVSSSAFVGQYINEFVKNITDNTTLNLNMPSIDLKMGLTTTDAARINYVLGSTTQYSTASSAVQNTWQTQPNATLPSMMTELQAKIANITSTNNLTGQSYLTAESGLVSAYNFLARNPTWSRKGAYLIMVFVSDENDYSNCTKFAAQTVTTNVLDRTGKNKCDQVKSTSDSCTTYNKSANNFVDNYVGFKDGEESLVKIYSLATVGNYADQLTPAQFYATSRYVLAAQNPTIHGMAVELPRTNGLSAQQKKTYNTCNRPLPAGADANAIAGVAQSFLRDMGSEINNLRKTFVLSSPVDSANVSSMTVQLFDSTGKEKQDLLFTLDSTRKSVTITDTAVISSGDSIKIVYKALKK